MTVMMYGAGRRTALIFLLVVLAGCQPDPATAPRRQPRPPATHRAEPPGQQPGPVQGDPGAHNTQPGELDLHVEWTSENGSTPACEWSKNGITHPCANMERAVKEPGVADYIGLWEHEERGVAGDVFTIAAQGNIGVKSIECSIYWKGAYHAGISNGRRCSITFTLT